MICECSTLKDIRNSVCCQITVSDGAKEDKVAAFIQITSVKNSHKTEIGHQAIPREIWLKITEKFFALD